MPLSAAVTTPDVAKDLFSGLWDKALDKDLFQAYKNLDRLRSTCPAPDQARSEEAASPAPSTNRSPLSSGSPCSDPGTMNTHPYYGAPTAALSTNKYTQLALLLVSQSQGQNLSREEEEKRRVRRERNKVAATKCREKRKAHSVYVRHEYTQVTDTTKKLEDQINALKRERDELMRVLNTHECHNPGLGRSTPSNNTLHHHHPHPSGHSLLQQAQMLPNTSLADLFIKSEPTGYN